jgi:hypothetical protein
VFYQVKDFFQSVEVVGRERNVSVSEERLPFGIDICGSKGDLATPWRCGKDVEAMLAASCLNMTNWNKCGWLESPVFVAHRMPAAANKESTDFPHA